MSIPVRKKRREQWGSQLGFVLSASGAAVGLGNIQRFPYLTASWGGAAFVLAYLLCVVLIVLPMMWAEIALGRQGQTHPVAAFSKIRATRFWKYVGGFSVWTAFLILCYYIVLAGWTLAFSVFALTASYRPLGELTQTPWAVILSTACFQLANVFIVRKGLQKGIERYNKILLPLLFILLCSLAIYSLTLPNSWAGIKFYLYPDFSKLQPKVWIYALTQAVFSLSVGEAVLLTYGSYSKREESLLVSGAGIAFFDTLSALLAGFIIFPALFAFNLDPNQQGMGLTFNIMPSLFVQMSWGRILGPAFFILLVFAALTTTVALFEIPVVYLTEARGYDRPRAVNRVGLASFLISIPIALSKGAHPWLSELSVPYFEAHKGLYEIFDFFCGSLGMLFGGFFICLFVGWVWGKQAALEEVRAGSPLLTRHPKLAQIWFLHIKYIIPPVILLLLVFL